MTVFSRGNSRDAIMVIKWWSLNGRQRVPNGQQVVTKRLVIGVEWMQDSGPEP